MALKSKIISLYKKIYWWWKLDRRENCATVINKKDYCYKVDVVGEIIETQTTGWVKYGCRKAGMWCVKNEIYEFDVVERYLSKEDFKLHFVFGFKHEEDAMAFRLGYVE